VAIADIEQLVESFCDIARVPAPKLGPDREGVWAATLRLRGTQVVLRQFGDRDADTVFLSFDFGEVAPHSALAAWHVLLEANLHMLGDEPPRFSRHPVTGHALLHVPYPLADATGADFHQRVEQGADLAARWRVDHFLTQPDDAHAWFDTSRREPNPEAIDAAAARFAQLHAAVFERLAQPAPPLDPPTGPRGFTLRLDGIDMAVLQSLQESTNCAFTTLRLARSAAHTELDDALALMDTNFHLAARRPAVRIAREPAQGHPLLLQALALDGATVQHWLDTSCELAEVAKEWQLGMQPAQASSGAPSFFHTPQGIHP
jgi:hypothetical protein